MINRQSLKKFGIPFLAGLVMLGSIGGFSGSKASAASRQPAQSVKQNVSEQSPAYTGSIFTGSQDNGKDESGNSKAEENDAALASKAKISGDDAIKAVKAVYPQNNVQGASLGDENGYLVYEVKMTDKAGKAFEAKVDAGNAKVLAFDNTEEESSSETGEATNEQKDSIENDSQGPDNDNVEIEE